MLVIIIIKKLIFILLIELLVMVFWLMYRIIWLKIFIIVFNVGKLEVKDFRIDMRFFYEFFYNKIYIEWIENFMFFIKFKVMN